MFHYKHYVIWFVADFASGPEKVISIEFDLTRWWRISGMRCFRMASDRCEKEQRGDIREWPNGSQGRMD